MSGSISPVSESEYVEELLRREPVGVDPVKSEFPERLKSQDARVAEQKKDFNTTVLHSRYTGKGSIINTFA